MSFSDKVVLVTGGSSGIGAATAILFAKEGARVAFVGRNEAKLSDVAHQCYAYSRPLIIRADVADEQQAATIVKKTVDHFGKLDILVNNAGFAGDLAAVDDPNILSMFDAVFNTNMRSVVQLTSLAVPHLKATKGNIVNVSSIAGLAVRRPESMSYNVSKAAMDHYTRCAALDLAPYGIRVNSVNPGPVKTDVLDNAGPILKGGANQVWEMLKNGTALGRIGEAGEIADLIAFLASEKARSITGSIFVSDNGALLKNN